MRVSFDLQGTLLLADNSAVRPEIVLVAQELAALGAHVVILTAIHEGHLAAGLALVIDLTKRHGLPWEIVPAVYSEARSMAAAKLAVIREMGISLHFDDLQTVVDYVNRQRIPAVAVQV